MQNFQNTKYFQYAITTSKENKALKNQLELLNSKMTQGTYTISEVIRRVKLLK
jgi:hypothetical protein